MERVQQWVERVQLWVERVQQWVERVQLLASKGGAKCTRRGSWVERCLAIAIHDNQPVRGARVAVSEAQCVFAHLFLEGRSDGSSLCLCIV